MKKFKFIAFIFAIMTTMPILQSCLDDDDNPSDLLVVSTINMISQDLSLIHISEPTRPY